MPRLTLRGYAKHRGCALSTVQEAIKSGRIRKDRRGLIDSDEADERWELRTNPNLVRRREARTAEARKAAPDPVGEMLQKARVAQLTFNARMAELEFNKKSGEVIDKADVARRAFENVRRARDSLLSAAERAAPLCVGLTEIAAIRRVIAAEIERSLEDLAHAFRESKNGNA